ncbi:50S ribosome-binding GTPase [Ceratobasidium sp. AG-Ba]|nr:50S ribosome-binding GTPase [Ceratobasidium sp. AG-Ba]QRW08934.1 50S ribosome-binding GTPase [Ceratobasidium sp. AG-Ba]
MSAQRNTSFTSPWFGGSLSVTYQPEPQQVNGSPPRYTRHSVYGDHNNMGRPPTCMGFPVQRNQMLLFVFGATGAGKTTLINNITGSDLKVGRSLESCTREIQASSMDYKGRQVIIYDTPGFDDSQVSDTDILRQIATFLTYSHERGVGRASGIIFVHDINNPRVSGTSLKNLRMFKGLVGDETLKNVVFVTNKWSSPPSPEHEARQKELETTGKYFGNAIQQGARVFRGGRDVRPEDVAELLDMFLPCKPSSFQIQKEMAEGLDLASTVAGRELGRELEQIQQKHREEVAELRKLMEDARDQDRALYEELQAEKHEAQKVAEEAERKQEELRSTLEEERRELAAKLGELERASREMEEYRLRNSNGAVKKSTMATSGFRVVGIAASLALAVFGLPIISSF